MDQYLLSKPLTTSLGQDLFILNPAKGTYQLAWVQITYDSTKKKFLGKYSQIGLPDISGCNDYLVVSNTGNNDSYMLCTVGRQPGSTGMVKAYLLESDGQGGFLNVKRAPWQDITYVDANGEFCPYKISSSIRLIQGLEIFSNCPLVNDSTRYDPSKYPYIEYKMKYGAQEYLLIMQGVQESLTIKPTSIGENDDTTVYYFKYTVSSTYHPQLHSEDTSGPGYDFCSLRDQYVLYRPGGDSLITYDPTFTTSKTYSAANLSLKSITSVTCSEGSNSIVVIGPDSVADTVQQYVIISGWVTRSQDDRSIIFRSVRPPNATKSIYTAFFSNLVMMEIGNSAIEIPDCKVVYTKNVYVYFNVTDSTTPVPPGSTYTISATKFDGSETASQTAKFSLYTIDESITITQKSATKEKATAGSEFNLKFLVDIKGPVVSTNLAGTFNHISLTPKTEVQKSNLMVYSNAKSFKDLQIKTLIGSKNTYDVYVNYSKLFRSVVPVGKSG